MFRNEWKNFKIRKFYIIALIAVITIPSIYSVIFLRSMWDPYGNIDKLPVAVVNNDIAVEYEDKEVNVGKEVVEKLNENDSLDFHFVGEAEANSGIEDGTYYMVISIPKNFSENAITLLDDEPQTMLLTYTTNPGYNFVASKLSESALLRIQKTISENVTSAYTEAIRDEIDGIGDSLQEGADGTQDLLDGEQRVREGADALDDGAGSLVGGIQTLSNGTGSLKSGTSELRTGLSSYLAGTVSLKDAISTLHSSIPSLTDGIKNLRAGAESAKSGADTLASYYDDDGELMSGASELVSGTEELNEKIKSNPISLNENDTDEISSLASKGAADQSETIAKGVLDGVSSSISKSVSSAAAQGGSGAAAYADEFAKGVTEGISEEIESLRDKISSKAAEEVGPYLLQSLKSSTAAVSTQSDASTAVTEGTTGNSDSQVVNVVNDNLLSYGQEIAKMVAGNVTDEIAETIKNEDSISAVSADLKPSLERLGRGIASQTATGIASSVNSESAITTASDELSSGLGKLGSEIALSTASSVVDGVNGALPDTMGVYTEQIAAGMSTLYDGLNELGEGTNSLAEGLTSLDEGAATLNTGSDTLMAGVSQLNDGAQTLTSNNEKLSSGAASLDAGVEELNSGAGELLAGGNELYDGTRELSSGLPELTEGTQTLQTALQDGADTVREKNLDEAQIDMVAAPVDSKEEKVTSIANNGTSMAAYMMPIAMWIGGIAFTLVYPLRRQKEDKTSGIKFYIGKASVMYPVAIAWALLMVGLLCVIDGFAPADLGATLLTACVTSVCFMSIAYIICTMFGKAGSFLMIIYLVLNISTATGVYPAELSPGFVGRMTEYFPFTHVVRSFRIAISGSDGLMKELSFLIIMAVGVILFSLIYYAVCDVIRARKCKTTEAQAHPSV